jgi:hypothetical protein
MHFKQKRHTLLGRDSSTASNSIFLEKSAETAKTKSRRDAGVTNFSSGVKVGGSDGVTNF